MLSICFPTYNHSYLAKQTILNIKNVCEGLDYEILCFDDWSTDDTEEVVKEHPNVIYKKSIVNIGVTRWWNWLTNNANGEIICIINDDCIFPKGFFEKLILGLTPDITITNWRFTQKNDKRVAYFRNKICGFCFMFKKSDKNKFFPVPEKLKIFSNDNRISSRIREQELKQKVVKNAIFYHMGSMTVRWLTNTDRILYAQMCRDQWWNEIPICPYEYDDLTSDIIF